MPILEIKNTRVPKATVRSEILRPPAKTSGLALPMASTESNAAINPKIEARKPITNPNNPESLAKCSIFLDFSVSVLRHKKPLVKKKMANTKQISIKDIINVPPSLNRCPICVLIIKLGSNIDNKFIVNGFS